MLRIRISKLLCDFIFLFSKDKIGCIGPYFFNTSSQIIEEPKLKTRLTENIIKVNTVITSSMMTKYSILKEINFWNEQIFLDMADWDLCWRLQKKKYKCYMTKNSIVEHSLGVGCKDIYLFKIRVGNSFRVYYQTRDCLKLLFKDYTPIYIKFRFLAMLSLRPLLHFIFLDNRLERIKYIIKGIRDYFKGVNGPL